MVIIVAPHTSNWDFVIGAAYLLASGCDAHFLGKDTLFRGPLGWIMRWLGGTPVDRSAAAGVVAQTVARFAERPAFVLALAPEGTRRRVEAWRTGFHRIARGAHVPIVCAYLDYGRKVAGFGPVLTPGDDLNADLAAIRAFYAGVRARHPEQFTAG